MTARLRRIGVAHLPRRCRPDPATPISDSVRGRRRHRRPAGLHPCRRCRLLRLEAIEPAGHRDGRPLVAGGDRRRHGPARAGTRPSREGSRSRCPRATRPGSRPAGPRSWPPPWPTGTTATSDPVHLGEPLAWRPVKANDPTGKTPVGPDFFATWDPEGGRFATLAGDLLGGRRGPPRAHRPERRTAFEIALDRAVVAAPPVWIDADRVAVVTGDAAAPTGGDRRHDDQRDDRRPGRRPAPRDVGAIGQADRHDGRPGCSGRGPRHGRLAGRRRLDSSRRSRRRAVDDGDRVRPRRERSAARGRLGRGGRLGHASPSTTAARTGDAWRNRRSTRRRGAVVAWLR